MSDQQGKKAFITGVTGQDGSYLAELLLDKGYIVIGMVRRSTRTSYERIEAFQDRLILEQGDLLDQASLEDILQEHQPDEIYNLAGQSFIGVSWKQPVLDVEATGVGATRMLEAARQTCPSARFYQASTSELFGDPREAPQSEETPFRPRNPYGVSKLYAHWMTRLYRANHEMYVASGILYNHESPRRGVEFVTRKITRGAAAIKLRIQSEMKLGNLDAERDWGFAGDYVEAMWRILQQKIPDEYVVATGELHSVRDLCQVAFSFFDLDYREYVVVDDEYFRPTEEIPLVGDASRARARLGWEPETDFENLIRMMAETDYDQLREEFVD